MNISLIFSSIFKDLSNMQVLKQFPCNKTSMTTAKKRKRKKCKSQPLVCVHHSIQYHAQKLKKTHFHGNPSSTGRHNDHSGCLSVPVSVSQLRGSLSLQGSSRFITCSMSHPKYNWQERHSLAVDVSELTTNTNPVLYWCWFINRNSTSMYLMVLLVRRFWS